MALSSMSRFVRVAHAAIWISLLLPLATAWSQAPQPREGIPPMPPSTEMRDCRGYDGGTNERQYDGCTWVIRGSSNAKDVEFALRHRARILLDLDRYVEAIEDFSTLLARDPSDAATYNLRGEAYLKLGLTDRAIENFSDAIRLWPKLESAWQNRANAYERKGNLDQAMADREEWVKLSGSANPTAFIERGLAWMRRGDYDRAITSFDAALERDPKSYWTMTLRGAARAAKGDFARAVEDYDAAHKVHYQQWYDLASSERCFAQAAIGRLEPALADCQAVLRVSKDNAPALASRGFVRLRAGQLDAAIADYNAALKAGPPDPRALFGRGVAKLRKGQRPAGGADIAEARKLQADIADVMGRAGVKP